MALALALGAGLAAALALGAVVVSFMGRFSFAGGGVRRCRCVVGSLARRLGLGRPVLSASLALLLESLRRLVIEFARSSATAVHCGHKQKNPTNRPKNMHCGLVAGGGKFYAAVTAL